MKLYDDIDRTTTDMRTFLIISLFGLNCFQVYPQKIFSVKYASDANFKAVVVDQISQADIKIYKEDVISQAKDNAGIWYFTKIRSEADKNVMFVEYLSQADLKIYFVKYRSQAGWINEEKKWLLAGEK